MGVAVLNDNRQLLSVAILTS